MGNTITDLGNTLVSITFRLVGLILGRKKLTRSSLTRNAPPCNRMAATIANQAKAVRPPNCHRPRAAQIHQASFPILYFSSSPRTTYMWQRQASNPKYLASGGDVWQVERNPHYLQYMSERLLGTIFDNDEEHALPISAYMRRTHEHILAGWHM